MNSSDDFLTELETALSGKLSWLNAEKLPEVLDSYRLLYTCVKNINDTLVKRSLVTPDPYKYDKRISEIATVDVTPFTDQEIPQILGARLSEYEMMLDFISTYFRFTVENVSLSKIKIFNDLNNVFAWDNVSTNNNSCNTRALAICLGQAKVNAPSITISLLNDSVEKCGQSIEKIASGMAEISEYQKEAYKCQIRKDLLQHPDFDKEKASASAEAEMAEIKRLFTKVVGKKHFYTDLIQEIIDEDQGMSGENHRQRVLAKLAVKQKTSRVEKKGPNPKELIMATAVALGGVAPILSQLNMKLTENFDLLYYEKQTFIRKIKASLKRSLGIKEKEHVCTFVIVDKKTEAKTQQKINVSSFLDDIERRCKVYNGIANKGIEYTKIAGATEEAALNFLNKQIQECQQLYVWIEALDDHFKTKVPIEIRLKVKGMKIDLSSFRNAIINVNKKRSDYVSMKEEMEQMRKLGI